MDKAVRETGESRPGKSLRVRTLSGLHSFISAPSPPNCPSNGSNSNKNVPNNNNGKNDNVDGDHVNDNGEHGNGGNPEQTLSPRSTFNIAALENAENGPPEIAAMHFNSIKRTSARELQERIQTERDRVVNKRTRLHQLRVETMDGLDGIELAENGIALPPTDALVDDSFENERPSETLNNVPTSIAFQHADVSRRLDEQSNQPLFVDDLDLSDPEIIRTLPLSFLPQSPSPPPSPHIPSSPTKPEEPPEPTTTKPAQAKPKNTMSVQSRNRALKWGGVILALVAIITTLVLVDRQMKSNYAASTSNSNSNSPVATPTDVACEQATNIFPDCYCQEELATPPTKEVAHNREAVLEYLIAVGAVVEDNTTTTPMSMQSCDVRNQALLWISDLENHPDDGMPTNLQLLQRFVLAVLYQRLDGNDWTSKSLWLDSKTSECEWDGIICNSVTDRIMELTLNDKNLRGELPALELGTLDGIRTLNMENNPSLTGMLTPQLAKLPLLQSLFLSKTGISGTLPTEFGSRLAELQLSSTVLTGTLPTELGLMERLRDLNLSHNRFTGTIPMELMIARDLEKLDLSSNRLTGSLPLSLWQSTTLDMLNLSENTGIVGPYPDPPSSLLTIINFAGTSLTGSVPNEYCNLDYLESLLVDCNGNNGTPPCRCCQCDDSE